MYGVISVRDSVTGEFVDYPALRGADGVNGASGRGITNIEKTETNGLVDTYTITYSEGPTSTFTVTNGQSLKINQSVSSQSISTTTKTYITGSKLQFSAGNLLPGVRFRWGGTIRKLAGAAAGATIYIVAGTTGTVSDTEMLSFAIPAGTSVSDTGRFVIDCCVLYSGSNGLEAHLTMTHNLSNTGLATVPCVNLLTNWTGFDLATPTNIGLCITLGTSENWTMDLVTAEAFNI